MRGSLSMVGWSAGTLQSKTRKGLLTARRWQSAHILATTGSSALRKASLKRARSLGQPTEFNSRVQSVIPRRSRNVASIARTSASRAGDSLPAVGGPITSAPI